MLSFRGNHARQEASAEQFPRKPLHVGGFRDLPLGCVRGIRTPEFDMMELVNSKSVAFGIVAHKVVIANQFHFVAVLLAVLLLANSLIDHLWMQLRAKQIQVWMFGTFAMANLLPARFALLSSTKMGAGHASRAQCKSSSQLTSESTSKYPSCSSGYLNSSR